MNLINAWWNYQIAKWEFFVDAWPLYLFLILIAIAIIFLKK